MLFYQRLNFTSQITNTHSHIICLLPTIVAPHISAYYVLTQTMFSKRYQREENKISDSVTESLIDYSVQSYSGVRSTVKYIMYSQTCWVSGSQQVMLLHFILT
jgi:hypothetical protein